jgi:hypothetical protein
MTAFATVSINEVDEARVVAVEEAIKAEDEANVEDANVDDVIRAASDVMVEVADIHAVVLEAKEVNVATCPLRLAICAVKSSIDVELSRVAVVLERMLT